MNKFPHLLKISFGIVILSMLIFSCRKNFTFDEIDKLSTDSMLFEGTVAAPILNTELTLGNFFPETDSSLWIEADENNLVHLRMYFHVAEYSVSQIYPDLPYPTPINYPVTADSIDVHSDLQELKVYSKMFDGHLFFRDPKITLKFFNEIPVVTYFRLDTLTFHTGDGSVLSNTQDKNYTILAPTQAGQIINTNILIDKNEIPVLPDVFSPIPKYVSFAVTVGSNENQNAAFAMTGNEKIKFDADIDLPIDARLEDLVMGDTIDFEWETGTYSQIQSATLKIFFKNGFPLDAVSQIYFADTTNTGEIGFLVDSIFTDMSDPNITNAGWHLKPAQTDAAGVVTIPQESRLLITIDNARVDLLKQHHASKLILVAKLNTFNSSTSHFIKMYSYYKFGVKLGIKADYSINTNDTLLNGK